MPNLIQYKKRSVNEYDLRNRVQDASTAHNTFQGSHKGSRIDDAGGDAKSTFFGSRQSGFVSASEKMISKNSQK